MLIWQTLGLKLSGFQIERYLRNFMQLLKKYGVIYNYKISPNPSLPKRGKFNRFFKIGRIVSTSDVRLRLLSCPFEVY